MLRLGLLETDELYDDLIDDYRSYGWMFRRFFEALGAKWQYRHYHIQQGQWPQQWDECDAWLITGSKSGVYDDAPWIPQLQQWIQQAYQQQQRLLGICFGHQILAHSLGGFAGQSQKGWGIGVHTTHIEHRPLWLNDDQAHIRLLYSHQDQVERLPREARRLAGSDFCPNAAFYIGDQVLGFQGHPEFTREYLQRLLPRRVDSIGAQTLQRSFNGLDQATDEERVGRWLISFIEQR
ncbi:hypothetical protein CHH28_18465 [Bacterioplanes sanyensis]|uniref:Glutamine amidotransferase domain-containing protein n=1 Tax=Bacterioplanes sanyensis TaxID=1249553 RepID=A0A222FP25_9GAMM|nr:hypothetical protein [Bacterioplanes sanyensis]ASP40529.1 hypothetical protein CHH28_18465 [Bacterioplanes sanyensis]